MPYLITLIRTLNQFCACVVLCPAGDFYRRKAEVAHTRGERADRVVHEDTLRMDGRFNDSTTSRQDFQTYTGERAEVVRHEDNLVTEGRFTGVSTSQAEHRQFTAQRSEVRHHEDNLKTSGTYKLHTS
jgi:hypothetical protein